ncbi:MAG: T9SS type A sorting domain-containing protein [Bacteroidota bacterium]|nr:T9SS type A sorting domain-containing protein [Bacteroidota bacterium]
MKRILLFTTTLLCAVSAFSQVKLNQNDFPKAWEKYILARDTSFSSGVSIGAGGTNQVWDYSAVFGADLYDTLKYSRASDHPKYAQFPEANLVSVSSRNKSESFIKIDSTGVWSYFGNPLDPSANALVLKVHTLNMPMTYGGKVIDSFKFVQSIPVDTIPFLDSVRISVNVISYTDVDAWGQLKLPNKTYTNCLRLKTWNDQKIKIEIHNTFTKSWTNAPFAPPSPNTNPSYLFFAQGEGDKVLELSADSNNNISRADYRSSSVLGINNVISATNTNIYPNPANNIIYINCDANQQINIYNAEGKQVLSNTKLYKGINTLNIADLENGIYFYRGITNTGGAIEGRFVKN